MGKEEVKNKLIEELYYNKYLLAIKQNPTDEEIMKSLTSIYHDGFEEARLFMLDHSLIKAFLRLVTKGRFGKII